MNGLTIAEFLSDVLVAFNDLVVQELTGVMSLEEESSGPAPAIDGSGE